MPVQAGERSTGRARFRVLVAGRFCPHGFDDALAGFKLPRDFGQQRFKPREQDAIGAVANSQPDNGWARGRIERALHEIIVLGDEHPTSGHRKGSDASVVRLAQADIPNGGGGVAVVPPATGPGRAAIGRPPESASRQVVTKTGWSR